ncbi:guanylate kinase-associated protein mars isoform X2 [Drosophila hydei]|uniref:Guanylate kinase-associated protein mars isoform X2 n=1 Tax=Drosophila hydei TaxID=7224 RepID=A0A6J1LVG6_DROHY|nr:guanylate kinase-associated protein mars isoform X2 [Drosophila hydei]
MENRKNLFKVSSGVLSSHNHCKINRERQRVVRSKIPANIEQENQLFSQNETSNNNKMSQRQANYLERFLKWKALDKHQASLKKGNGCKGGQAVSQPSASIGSENHHNRRSLYVVDNRPERPTKQSEKPLFLTSTTSNPPKTNTFTNLPTKSSAAVKSSHIVNRIQPFAFGESHKNLKTKPKSVQTNLLTRQQVSRSALTENQTSSECIKEKPPKQINLKQKPPLVKSTVLSVKSSRPPNLITKPFEAAATSGNSRGGRAVQTKTTLAQRKGVKPLLSELSTRMKAKNSHSKQKQIRQIISTKLDQLQEICDLQTPSTPKFKAQATSTQNKSNNSEDNLLEPNVNTSNNPMVDVSSESNGTVAAAKRQLLPPSPKVSKSQNSVDAAEDELTLLATTPPRYEECQSSPFVTASRGKGKMQLEDDNHSSTLQCAAVSRIMDSVTYFRIQLDNEIKRLHSLCDEWHLYSNQNEERLLETGAKDIIDAAIGQTKLLTSKKFMQFKGLIDRCESGATGIDQLPNDGSEASKPVFVDDLEGWWDMLRLQSQNVDKRFDILQRLKANDWIDQDAGTLSKTKSKVGPKAKLKPTAKPSSELKSFLRKAFADKRRQQATQAIIEESNQLNQTPKRCLQHRLIVVRDRKSFSPVRTVLRVSNGSVNRPSIGVKSLLKSAIMGAAEQLTREQLTPARGQPMSILKTPATKKRENSATRNVIFSAKKKVRRFQFTFDEGNVSGDETIVGCDKLDDCEEDMSLEKVSLQDGPSVSSANSKTGETCGNTSRTYSLRNRLIKLRASSEFM